MLFKEVGEVKRFKKPRRHGMRQKEVKWEDQRRRDEWEVTTWLLIFLMCHLCDFGSIFDYEVSKLQIRTSSHWILPNWWTVTATDASVSSATDMELTEQLFCFRQIRVIITRSIPQLIGILLCVFFSAAEAFLPEVSNWPQLNFGSVILKQHTNYAPVRAHAQVWPPASVRVTRKSICSPKVKILVGWGRGEINIGWKAVSVHLSALNFTTQSQCVWLWLSVWLRQVDKHE